MSRGAVLALLLVLGVARDASAVKYMTVEQAVKTFIPDDAKITTRVGIGPREDGTGFGIDAALEISSPGVDKAVLEDLVQKAHIVCPYSHATKGNIDVKLTVA